MKYIYIYYIYNYVCNFVYISLKADYYKKYVLLYK